jgi:hypothetical protein
MFTALSLLNDVSVKPDAAPPRSQLVTHRIDDPQRSEVEDFIHGVFASRYGADVQHFAPHLVSLQVSGEIVAAAGYRSAADGPLFLERYLSYPVETLLASQAQVRPLRRSVVEVGHLAASRPGEGRRLIGLIGPYLSAQEFVWVVGTITCELRQLFIRIGVTPLALGTADPAALGSEASHWGSYYDHHPVVLAGNLGQALRRLARPSRSMNVEK